MHFPPFFLSFSLSIYLFYLRSLSLLITSQLSTPPKASHPNRPSAMVPDQVISMDAFVLGQLPVEPDVICDAWLEAHFDYPAPGSPLTRGLFPVACDPHTSSAAASIVPGSATASQTLPKSPREFLDKTVDLSGGLDLVSASQACSLVHKNDCVGGLLNLRNGTGASAVVGVNPVHGSVPERLPHASPDDRHPAGRGAVASAGAGTGKDGAAGGPTDDVADGSLVYSPFPATIGSSDGSCRVVMPPPQNKRKAKSLSPMTGSKASPDTRVKRKRLSSFHPSGTFGIPDLASQNLDDDLLIPEEVIEILAVTFSVGYFETECFPITPGIEQLLAISFRHESIPPHARLVVSTDADRQYAQELIEYAVDIHRACLQNSLKGEDEAAWYPLVRGLLSVEPPPPKSSASSMSSPPIARPPRQTFWVSPEDLFFTVDATTKSTNPDLAPYVNTKLDILLAFNPEHPMCAPAIAAAVDSNIPMSVFNDGIIDEAIVVLAVKVKPTGGAGGEMEAEYQVGAWGMKMLNLTRSLEPATGKCNFALSVSVCGHVWSLHVTYWRDSEIVTHGPLCIGATDSLYGTMKIMAFVRRLKEWARDELWPDWEELMLDAVEKVHADRGMKL